MTKNYLEILSIETDGKRTFWSRIGTAFPTKDGNGYRLKLNLIPQGASPDILMLPPKAAVARAEGEGP